MGYANVTFIASMNFTDWSQLKLANVSLEPFSLDNKGNTSTIATVSLGFFIIGLTEITDTDKAKCVLY